jgi:integrase/recombinase XerD
MTEKAISPLRRRMIEDMSARRFGEKTQSDYIRHVANFAKFLGRPLDTATGSQRRFVHRPRNNRDLRHRLVVLQFSSR